MAPHRKRQRLSEDGHAAGIIHAEEESTAAHTAPSADTLEKTNLSQRRSLFVRSLPANTTSDDLTEHFSQSYPIKHATAVLDPTTKKCKGYGFVTFADAEDAQQAKEDFNGSALHGRKMQVDIAEPRHRDDTGIPGKKALPAAPKRGKAAQQEQPQQSRLIIRNLPWSIETPEQLSLLFRSYGKIKEAVLPKNKKKPGVLAGFGIVVVRGRKNAEKAIKGLNGKEIDGRPIAVDFAVGREDWQKEQYQGEDGGVGDEIVDVNGEERSQHEDEDAESDDSDGISDDEQDVEDEDSEGEDDELHRPVEASKSSDNSSTLFVRNLPFTCDDETLVEHFSQFGAVRYARIVVDHTTERPRGTGFVCFFNVDDAESCLKAAPKQYQQHQKQGQKADKESTALAAQSILQNEDADPTGKYTMDGRVLQVTKAVDRSEAAKLTAESAAKRFKRDTDKRRLYLLSEGTIATNSPLYQTLAPSEVKMREASAKQRKSLIESNPSLHLSFTRLAIRNIPRNVTSKDLKALAREAVVGFASDVKKGIRKPLSREELHRGGEEMKHAEKERREKGKGVVKQAMVVFEGKEGRKVAESSGAGRSRGYGFIEYYTHRSTLMGLRWLNGHAIDYSVKHQGPKKLSKDEIQDKKKRLIVEFAIENAQVVGRRREREEKHRNQSGISNDQPEEAESGRPVKRSSKAGPQRQTLKRKRSEENGMTPQAKDKAADAGGVSKDGKLAKRQKIIARKRAIRRTRKKSAKA